MQNSGTKREKKVAETCAMYSVVFKSRQVRRLVTLIVCSFLLQPIAPIYAYANEISEEETALPEVQPTSESVEQNQAIEENEETTTKSEQRETDEKIQNESKSESGEVTIAQNTTEERTESTSPNVNSEPVFEENTAGSEDNATSSIGTEKSTKSSATSSLPTTNVKSATTSATTSPRQTTDQDVIGNEHKASTTQTEGLLEDQTSTTNASTTKNSAPNDGGVSSSRDEENTHEEAATENGKDENENLELSNSTHDTLTGTTTMQGSETGSTTESETGSVVMYSQITNDENYYHFGKDECVFVEEGFFYCGEKDVATTSKTVTDGLIAAPDEDGDLEIYLVKNGEYTQITHNLVDDGAPDYDAVSNTIVFHRLINDRYQIVVYDLKTGIEHQLTNGNENNMEPSRYGDHIVWQRWNVNDWDIMDYEGGTTTMLSKSPEHDVAPQIHENLVMWNTTVNNEPKVIVHDLKTGEQRQIDDADASAVLNPRIMLVYDTTHENGDVVTKGYDVNTGEVVPLSALPREIPDEIPDPDDTGEIRALVQSKPPKEYDSGDLSDGNEGGVKVGPTSKVQKNQKDLILDLSIPTSTNTTSVDAIPGTIPDVVVPSLSAEQAVANLATSTYQEVPDIIVPAKTPSTTLEVR